MHNKKNIWTIRLYIILKKKNFDRRQRSDRLGSSSRAASPKLYKKEANFVVRLKLQKEIEVFM